jgi:hypothetical protein
MKSILIELYMDGKGYMAQGLNYDETMNVKVTGEQAGWRNFVGSCRKY